MDQEITISVVHFTPERAKVRDNFQQIMAILNNSSLSGEVVVFPELALSGYLFTQRSELESLALEQCHPYVQQLQQYAKRHQRVVILGAAEKKGEGLYNSAWIFDPSRDQPVTYRKLHLFGTEKTVFDPGEVPPPVMSILQGRMRLGVMICYDFRFPEVARLLALQGADCIAVPANFVTSLWPDILRVRAIENKVFIAVANRGGQESVGEKRIEFVGKSRIFHYNGTELATLQEGSRVATAAIIPAKARVKRINAYNDLFADRRPTMYQPLCQ